LFQRALDPHTPLTSNKKKQPNRSISVGNLINTSICITERAAYTTLLERTVKI